MKHRTRRGIDGSHRRALGSANGAAPCVAPRRPRRSRPLALDPALATRLQPKCDSRLMSRRRTERPLPIACAAPTAPYAGSEAAADRQPPAVTNVRRAFHARDADGVCGKTILLVDDVLTSGATASECAPRPARPSPQGDPRRRARPRKISSRHGYKGPQKEEARYNAVRHD